jgi:L-threonylcarbamoyladenylate synthase
MERIVKTLKKGGIVAYPTETIYGLGVDALNEAAIERLLRIKGRRSAKAVSILVRDVGMLHRVVSRIPVMAREIMDRFWPGPVTIIFPAAEAVPAILTAYTGTVGVRISPHPFAERLFTFFDSPLTSTSANLSGEISLLEPEDILRTFGGHLDLVVAMPEFMEGVRSTVVDVTGERPTMVRAGAVDMTDIFPGGD